MRTAFIEQLTEEAKVNPNIFLLVGDLGYSVVEPFANLFPDRFLNAGIAEQNMTGVAAGLAMEGYNVFTYSIGNFPTLRCMEQIRYDVCYHNLSVKIVAVGGGYAYGPLGVSHHTTEDIGMLRTIPNLTVCAPGDPIEAKFITAHLCNTNTPGYLRLGKAGEPVIHSSADSFKFGKILPVISGTTTAVLTTGGMLSYAADYITKHALNYSLYSVPVIKPIDTDSLIEISKKYTQLITMEEHQRSGGFGSAVLETLNEIRNAQLIDFIPRLKIIAIPDVFIGYAGSQDFLRKEAGLVLFDN
jgi:transketolase